MTENAAPEAPANDLHSVYSIRRAMHNVLRCDSAQSVRVLFDFFLEKNLVPRVIFGTLDWMRNTPVGTATVLAYGILAYCSVRKTGSGDAATIALRDNERGAIKNFKRDVPDQPWTDVSINKKGGLWTIVKSILTTKAFRAVGNLRRSARIARRLLNRHGLFHSMRMMETVFYYFRFMELFRDHKFNYTVMSSAANPHAVAFNLAAKRSGVRSVIVLHSMPTKTMGRLFYDLAIVESEAAKNVYEQEAAGVKQFIVKSSRPSFRPMQIPEKWSDLTAALFLSKDPQEDVVRKIIDDFLEHGAVERFLVRPHPANLDPGLRSRLTASYGERVFFSAGGPAHDDIAQSDLIVAGNSGVHVEAVLAGKLSCFVAGLDHSPFDLLGFVDAGLIYHLKETSAFDPEKVVEFYSAASWLDVLRIYANIDQEPEQVAVAIRKALGKALEK